MEIFKTIADTLVDNLGEATYVLPVLIVLLMGLISPLFSIYLKKGKLSAIVSFVGMIIATVVTIVLVYTGTYGTAYNLFKLDAFSGLMMLLFLAVGGLTVFISPAHAETTKHQGEYYGLISIIIAGMMIVSTATNLITIFVGVELVSVMSYALVALKKNDPRSSEAAVKYLIVGGISSAITLYGMSMMFGVFGTLDLATIFAKVPTVGNNWAFVVACIAMIAGYGFKISAVPFHSWAPDVYEGASTPVSGLLAVGSKKMGFVVLLKIFLGLFIVTRSVPLTDEFQYVFAILAAITMTVGNLVAISQTNIKRMLAYSSIAQAGYILIALAVMSSYAAATGLFHMFTHVVMKGGAFVIVAGLITAGIGEEMRDYRGLAKRAPLISIIFMLFLFSLAGIPPLAGFTSKLFLFSSALYVDGSFTMQWLWLVFIAVINSAISLYYYARVVKVMLVDKPTSEEPVKVGKSFTIAAILCLIGVIVMGVYPQIILDLCEAAANALF